MIKTGYSTEQTAELELELFHKLTKVEFGLDFQGKNEAMLIKAIQIRMQANSLHNQYDYYHQLSKDKNELQELVCLLTINETYFYREADHLKFLTDSVVPKLQASKTTNDPIRILSIGCSTGAEPYSIAMALDQKYAGIVDNSFTIIGADVDYRALESARTARYNSLAFRALDENLKQHYFIEEGSSQQYGDQSKNTYFVLKPEIQKRVSFHYMNIISDIIEPKMKKMDVIFFRNVSIYFDSVTLLSIHKKFASMLNPNGYLIVGLTESMSNNVGLLKLKKQDTLFYFQKQDIKSTAAEFKVKNLNPIKTNKKIFSVKTREILAKPSKTLASTNIVIRTDENTCTNKGEEKNTNSLESAKALVLQKYYDKALLLLDDLSVYFGKEKTEGLLLRAFILFNRQEFDKAYKDALQVLDLTPFSVDVFLLLGMIVKWQKNPDKSISWFKKALYIHSNCWPAHYYLAGLYFEEGNLQKATQEYRLVLQQLAHPEEKFLSRMSIPLSLPKAEIRLLCQSYLSKIADQSLHTDMEKRYGN